MFLMLLFGISFFCDIELSWVCMLLIELFAHLMLYIITSTQIIVGRDAQWRPGGFVSIMIWRVLAGTMTMLRIRMNVDWESGWQPV